jgi:hypothetical protein
LRRLMLVDLKCVVHSSLHSSNTHTHVWAAFEMVVGLAVSGGKTMKVTCLFQAEFDVDDAYVVAHDRTRPRRAMLKRMRNRFWMVYLLFVSIVAAFRLGLLSVATHVVSQVTGKVAHSTRKSDLTTYISIHFWASASSVYYVYRTEP